MMAKLGTYIRTVLHNYNFPPFHSYDFLVASRMDFLNCFIIYIIVIPVETLLASVGVKYLQTSLCGFLVLVVSFHNYSALYSIVNHSMQL
ncbi:hypothetical protein X975_26954, partial [Stegodyphus mimosarum]